MNNTWKILLTATAIITIGLWIVPSFENITILQDEVFALQNKKNEKNSTIKLFRAESKKAKNTSDVILKSIPYSREQEIIIRDLQSISARTGFVFKGLSFGKGQNPEVKASQTTVSFTVLGQKQRISEFLTLIETNTRFMGTDTLNITIKETENQSLAELKISLYAFSQEL